MGDGRIRHIALIPGLILALFLPRVNAGVWDMALAKAGCPRYQPLQPEELELAESLFSRLLAGEDSDARWLRSQWAKLGYRLSDDPDAGPAWLVFSERGPGCRGQGTFLFRKATRARTLLQVPHAYSDLHTGQIAGELVPEGFDVLAWNSVKRRYREGGTERNADLAKRTDSLFFALTRAMAKTLPRGRLIQLHGFENRKRQTDAGRKAAVILSGGSTWISLGLDAVARCLDNAMQGPVLVFPRDVAELGAKTNIHGRTLKRYGHHGFLHVELNRVTRDRLRRDPQLRKRFAHCLTGSLAQ